MILVKLGFGPKRAVWWPTSITLKSAAHKNFRLPPTDFRTWPLKLLECASLCGKNDNGSEEGFIPKTQQTSESPLPPPLHEGTRVLGVWGESNGGDGGSRKWKRKIFSNWRSRVRASLLIITTMTIGEGYVRYKGKISHKVTRLPNVKMEEGMLPLNELLPTYLRERERESEVLVDDNEWKCTSMLVYICWRMCMCVCACMCNHILVLAHVILTFYKWAEHASWITT